MFSDSGHASPPSTHQRALPTPFTPIGLRSTSVLQENAREWRVLHFDHLGDVVQIEVGAMLVGRIVNHKVDEFHRGDEKGYFLLWRFDDRMGSFNVRKSVFSMHG